MRFIEGLNWVCILGILVAVETQIGNGTMSLSNMVPEAWIPFVKAWSANLGSIGALIMSAGVFGKQVSSNQAPIGTSSVVRALLFAFLLSAFLAPRAYAADVAPASKAISQALSYNYPTTKCGLYYGVNTMGSTGSVNNAQVGTQVVQGDIGLTLGYTCPMGKGYWFVDASADFPNFNGSQNGFSVTGPAAFMERFGFGAPIDLVMSMIPGLSSLQNAVPSLIPLPTGINVVTSSPYIGMALHEEDVGLANGFASNKQWLLSTGFVLGNKTRLSNGVVFDPFVEYILPSSRMCFGPLGGSLCSNKGSQVNVGMILEF